MAEQMRAALLPNLPPHWELLDHMGGWQPIEKAWKDDNGDIQVDLPSMNVAYGPNTIVTVRPQPAHPE